MRDRQRPAPWFFFDKTGNKVHGSKIERNNGTTTYVGRHGERYTVKDRVDDSFARLKALQEGNKNAK